MKKFPIDKTSLDNQYNNIKWENGLTETELNERASRLVENKEGFSKAVLKAKAFELVAENAPIAVDKDDIFQDKLFHGGIVRGLRWEWEDEIKEHCLAKETEEVELAFDAGAYISDCDFGHISPNSQLLVDVGFTGLLDRINEASKREGLTDKQKDFYESCRIMISAILTFLNRMSDAVRPYNEENSIALKNIANGAPKNIYEAMQILVAYFFIHEYACGARVRTLGRVDVLLYPFYKRDIENGTFTKDEIKDMLKFFLNKFWAAKVAFDLPFCLGGIDKDGNEVTNELSYLVVETYNELNIHSPKIHIRVSDKTPAEFVKIVLNCIRGGNSSFVFVNDDVAIKALMGVGIEEQDAKNYVPIGCYEPAVWGMEIGCTGNGGVNLAKAVELVITNGKDLKTGKQVGVKTGKQDTYEDFLSAVKEQIRYMAEKVMDYISKIENYYNEIYPDPILSSMYDESIKRGVDVYEGGAKYNNSSIYFYCIATLVDSISAVKRLIFEDKRLTFDEFGNILKNNWEGNEKLKIITKSIPEKYGNNNPTADEITRDITDFCAEISNNRPNGRGGVFKASCFSIDRCFTLGEKTMATPDGRMDGEPLSKNMCATTAMDKKGITALINSVTRIDHSKFPNGSVLDVVLHPSAVKGDSGLEAFYGILKTYMKKGGFAMHGNVFDAKHLRDAQENPEKYQTLQVRVCGWNAYFVNLTKAEQDAFIKQAENAC